MNSKLTIGVVIRVSDVRGRDKRGDRYIAPDEQIRTATIYCSDFNVAVFRDENVSRLLDAAAAGDETAPAFRSGGIAVLFPALAVKPLTFLRERLLS